jgi:aspartate kinase
MLKVAKFGGSSLADARQIRKVAHIVKSDSSRKLIVVSAPGKRNASDQKVTDLFIEWHRLVDLNISADAVIAVISERFSAIVQELGVDFGVEEALRHIARDILNGQSAAYAASRGEYLMGIIMAKVLGFSFIDPADHLLFTSTGQYLYPKNSFQETLQGGPAVIPGFYGAAPDGSIRTFSRGGSDVTGAIVAEVVNADVYENWTDVSGLLMADPRIVDQPRTIAMVSYRELRELSYMGANVFHEEATFPVKRAGIPINIKNTNHPEHLGTMIVAEHTKKPTGFVTGIAGRKHFSIITVEKLLMNQEIGFVRRILTILEDERISFEHMPSGVDTLSIIVDSNDLSRKADYVAEKIKAECQADCVSITPDIAMIAVVGRNMAHTPGVAAQVCTALAKHDINIRMINQGASELNIIVGVEYRDYENAIRALYLAFPT